MYNFYPFIQGLHLLFSLDNLRYMSEENRTKAIKKIKDRKSFIYQPVQLAAHLLNTMFYSPEEARATWQM